MSAVRSIFPLLLMLSAIACADDHDGAGSGDGRDTAVASGGTSGGTSSAGGEGQGGEGGHGVGGAAGYVGVGSVGVYSDALSGPGAPTSLSGAWATYRIEGTGVLDCDVTAHGACMVIACEDIPPVAPPPTYLSAGVIDIAGGQRAIMLTPVGVEYSPESSLTEPLFSGGETITFDVDGDGEIPPHSGSVIAPSRITMIDFPSQGATIDRATPLSLGWTGGSVGHALVLLQTEERSEGQLVGSVSALCRFDAAGGAGVLPTSALALLPPSSTEITAGLAALALSDQTVVAGDYLVAFAARSWAVTPSGELASRAVTLE